MTCSQNLKWVPVQRHTFLRYLKKKKKYVDKLLLTPLQGPEKSFTFCFLHKGKSWFKVFFQKRGVS